ncbi:hypothetical protein LTR53_017863 [Teratosphaeriaceae sp. CCFEE 6253]|nr:hypothetical protein LTR53_017863 [Teratosphaeriaceae sp. CCFEE 6253]
MPLIEPPPLTALPFIDPPPPDAAMAAAHSLILADLPANHTNTLHPSLPTSRPPHYSPLIATAHARLASNTLPDTQQGIDLTRYAAPEPPAPDASPAERTAALRQACISAEYLHSRETNLALLETFGRNAWLVSNARLEDDLRALEREVEGAKGEVEGTQRARRERQEGARGEVLGLEAGWRGGLGRMMEVLAAGEGVRGEVLERRRAGVS